MLKFFCIQKAQKFEFCVEHVSKRCSQSFFGYVYVLPGSFSAYRWDTLKKQKDKRSIIDDEYLISVLDPNFTKRKDYNIKKANMVLANERTMCLEIFSKKDYIIKYLPDASCKAAAIKHFVYLMKQRRRWINGAWFTLFYILKMFKAITFNIFLR